MATQQSGVLARVAHGWRDPRASVRSVLDANPSEATILSLVMLAALLSFVGRTFLLFAESGVASEAGGSAPDPEAIRGRLGAQFIGAMFFAPLMLYGVAALTRMIGRAAGGSGDWVACRAAIAWAGMLTAPLLLLLSVVGALAIAGGAVPPGAQPPYVPGADASPAELVLAVPGVAGLVLAAYIWAACIAEVHGFSNAWRVLGVIVLPAAAFAAALSAL